LAFFREEDAPFFFGRQAAIEMLANTVSKRHFVAVVGSSGSGKSSVVRAGLVPHLRQDTHAPWEIVTIVPNDRPLYNLAAALAPLLEPDRSETDQLIEINKQADALANGTLHLRDVIERILNKQPGTAHCLLIVDQWEELYTLTTSDDERRRFIDNLLEATAAKAVSVVLTLRGDFVSHALAYRPLSDRLQDAQVNLGPMHRDELQLAIEQPAAKVNATFEPGLVTRILDDVGEEPGNLPLLAFVLHRLWEDAVKHNGRLRHDAYKDMGGVQGALANTAEARL
jgi:energy-coupling factor transporter ATP-binding protein EcfA2